MYTFQQSTRGDKGKEVKTTTTKEKQEYVNEQEEETAMACTKANQPFRKVNETEIHPKVKAKIF